MHTKLTITATAVAAALAFASGSTLAAKAGTYKATAQGHNGPVTVEMTVDAAGKIAALRVTDNKETVGIADAAIRILPENIVKHQSLGIDALNWTSRRFSRPSSRRRGRSSARRPTSS